MSDLKDHNLAITVSKKRQPKGSFLIKPSNYALSSRILASSIKPVYTNYFHKTFCHVASGACGISSLGGLNWQAGMIGERDHKSTRAVSSG